MTGTVEGFEVRRNRDSEQLVVMLQVALPGYGDEPQPVEYMTAPGDTIIPPIGSIVKVLDAGRAWKIAVACNDGIDIDNTVGEGERLLYSSSSGGVQSTLHLKADGTIEINGNSKRFVTHAELNSALQTFVTALNAEFATINTGASAAIAASGLWLTPLATGANSIDISASETQTVKTGG